MTFSSSMDLLAAFASVALAFAVVRQTGRSLASAFFGAGMLLFATECASHASAAWAHFPGVQGWSALLSVVAGALIPGCWLCFSICYSRGGDRRNLSKWKWLIAACFVLPGALVLIAAGDFFPTIHPAQFGAPDGIPVPWVPTALHGVSLVTLVAVLANLEYTLQAAVGMMRVRVKLVVLGLVVIFGARIYTSTEALLFSASGRLLEEVNAGALLVGCLLVAIGHSRSGFSKIDLYPSKAVLQSSVAVLLVGGYLVVVGVLAQTVRLLGGAENFQIQALIVLSGIALLAVLLFSNRLRQSISENVSRHFGRPRYDFRKIWSQAIRHTSNVGDQATLCRETGRLVAETFDILAVDIWLSEESQERLLLAFSTTAPAGEHEIHGADLRNLVNRPADFSQPFRLAAARPEWAQALRRTNAGPESIFVPLCAADRLFGFVIVGERVRRAPYTAEEIDLLKCLGDQLTGALLNLRLARDLMQAKELDAFQSMSAFFVHDLKNATASLNLLLQNFPVHFANPLFREEALRGLKLTSQRIQQLIARLGTMQHKLELKTAEADLNEVVAESFATLENMPEVEVVRELRPLPKLLVDREQMGSVVTNLLLNAREAIPTHGRIQVETHFEEGRAILSVSDTGCGMSPAFLRDSLFRPFHTTKKRGLGIGMFQSKVIVEAHLGSIHVASVPGKGTTFRVSLPA